MICISIERFLTVVEGPMVLRIAESMGIWLVLMFVGTNLIGLVVRGLLWKAPVIDDESTERVRDLVSGQMAASNKGMTVVAGVLSAAYGYGLWHFGGELLALAGGLVAGARLPDLLWEIRSGRKITEGGAPRGLVYMLAQLAAFGALPVIYLALKE
jgi:hypothetical protein